MKIFDLEDRFIDYTIRISNVVDQIDNSKLGTYIAGQLIRSGSSPALNYSETQSAESRKDFVHKLKIILKELKESRICLKIIERKSLIAITNKLATIKKETEELITIIYKSIETAKSNMQKK
ncbi:MAG: four helix bundle protein [Ignavibacteriae bacterium]|nr:four helix bundle protein [Ignavibacteriota bacterium]